MGFIIGTAGHIDHGKTSLVKALTGQDTDRLKEEKERGISIDLGFAYLDLPDGSRAGVVDVPGHERFIRNMLAGAHGMDLVLFTVAADDGVMPQTEEHLDILHLLGVRRAIFVVTKVDAAAEPRIRDVEQEIVSLVAGTELEGSATVRFSSVTGEGLESLRARIAEILQQSDRARSPGYFRLPVDRVFVLQGHGLVVTGTATSGEVKVGDRIRCLPGGQTFRVRNLHVHNAPVECGTAGQRIALNLAGAEAPSIARGHVICDERLSLTSNRFDAWLEVRPSATMGLKDHQRVRVHQGTAERLGRVLLLTSNDKIGPGQSAYCQLTVAEPLHLLRGDRFIIRDETARRTLGGGLVVHPWAKKHRRTDLDLPYALQRLHTGDPEQVVETVVGDDDDFAVPIDRLCQFLNLREQDVERLIARAASIRAINLEGELLYTSAIKWARAAEVLIASLDRFHAAHPLAPGMDVEALRGTVQMAPRLFRAFVEQLEASRTVVREANVLRLPSHTVRLGEAERTLVEQIKSALGANPLAPPSLTEIERRLGIGRARLAEVVRLMERDRLIVRVGADLYFLAGAVEGVERLLRELGGDHREITPAAFRDAVDTTRKFAIPLLEYFDRAGITVRVGEKRRLKQATPIARP